MAVVLTVLAVLLLLFANEVWVRIRHITAERSRKFVHITVGSFVAFWPFFLSHTEIMALSLAFLAGVAVSKYQNIFPGIHSVHRSTWGEICFALAVGLVALLTNDKWIYMAAVLQMSLADGLAAVVGTAYGHKNRYSVLGHTKSLVGTLTFFVVSATILLVYSHYGTPLPLSFILSLSLGVSLIENIGIKGLDNLLVPLAVAVALLNY
jgi:dolichol kinase